VRVRDLAARLRHPQTTVRWRLTLLYGGLFLVCGAALLAVTYTLVARFTTTPPEATFVRAPSARFAGLVPAGSGPVQSPAQRSVPPQLERLLRSSAGKGVVRAVVHGQQISDLHQLELWSGIALAIMAVISAFLGWVVAGRVLRPLRTITTATQHISEASLHQRLAMPGPRDELRTLADTIDGLLERLERAFEAQRRFVANASHELRTPLTASRALLEMVMSDPNATVDTFRATCAQALEEGERQEQLIGALLALAQGQRGIDRREPVDLAELTRSVLEAHELDAAADGLTLQSSLERVLVSGDRRLIERLVSNLVENAIRYNAPGGHVHVRVDVRAEQASLRIANSGPVVPAGEIEQLTQPFQRMSGDRVIHRGGLGLGLSIVAAITSAHGGALSIRSADIGGLSVEVRLPVAPRDGALRETRASDDRSRALPAAPV
jgi:signal transduction histidine kinase